MGDVMSLDVLAWVGGGIIGSFVVARVFAWIYAKVPIPRRNGQERAHIQSILSAAMKSNSPIQAEGLGGVERVETLAEIRKERFKGSEMQ